MFRGPQYLRSFAPLQFHLLCSRAAIPCRRQFLRKSARNRSSSFFLEKKKLASKPSAKTQLGPQPRLQASAVLSKIAKCHAREIEHARERRKITIRLRGHAAAPSERRLNFQKEGKSTHPNTCRPPRQPPRSRALPVQNFYGNALPDQRGHCTVNVHTSGFDAVPAPIYT